MRRGWLDEADYADCVALCQVLPGPTSSQVGMLVGLRRAGARGAVAAWLGFTLPSALLLTLFALGVARFGPDLGEGWLHGLKAAAVAVVAQAVIGMARSLAPDAPRRAIAAAVAVLALTVPGAPGQIGAILLGAAFGLALYRDASVPDGGDAAHPGRRVGALCLALYGLLLVGLPVLAAAHPTRDTALAAAFYRAGALVFGGGHMVLPLLQGALVPGFVSNDAFLAGYGAAQAVPGPLFTLAAYLGAAIDGVGGAALGLALIFLPSALLVPGILPFWAALRRAAWAARALKGVNAAVVGLLAAALYDPVWTSGIRGAPDLAIAALAFLGLTAARAPAWLVVALAAAAGAVAAGWPGA